MDDTFPTIYDRPNESPGFLLWQVTNLWQKHIRAALEEVSLTHVQFVLLTVLAYLGQKNQTITQVQLAQHAKTDVMMTSQVLRTLEEKGLVLRISSQTDTRAKNISLTPAGQAIVGQSLKLMEQADIKFFADLQPDLPKFIQLLQKLLPIGEK